MKNHDLYKIHISVFLFGFAGLFGKWIHLDALILVWGRVIFATLAFGLLFLYKKQNPFKISIKTSGVYLFLGGLLAFHWWSFFIAIQVSTVAIGLFSFSTFPIFTVLLEPLFFKEKWRFQYFLMAALSTFGIYLLVPNLTLNPEYIWGIIWGIASGFSFSLLTILNRLLLKKQSAIEIAFFQDFFALLIISPFIISGLSQIAPVSWLQLLVLGVIFTALAHVLFIGGLRTVQAKQASLIANMEPIYGSLFAFLLLGEKLNWSLALGGCIILLSAFYSVFLPKSKEY